MYKSLFPGSWDDGTRTPGPVARARLSEYVRTLHGEDLALRELVDHEGREYARANLRFALLEFWSMRTSDEHVLARESYWKDVPFVAEVRLQQN